MNHFLVIISALTALLQGEVVKLVDKNTDATLIEFTDNTPVIHSRVLERALKEEGIPIPVAMQKDFANKEVIFFEDPLFQKAFVEVYWPFYLQGRDSSYEWEK